MRVRAQPRPQDILHKLYISSSSSISHSVLKFNVDEKQFIVYSSKVLMMMIYNH
jgi:hypothetical protein